VKAKCFLMIFLMMFLLFQVMTLSFGAEKRKYPVSLSIKFVHEVMGLNATECSIRLVHVEGSSVNLMVGAGVGSVLFGVSNGTVKHVICQSLNARDARQLAKLPWASRRKLISTAKSLLERYAYSFNQTYCLKLASFLDGIQIKNQTVDVEGFRFKMDVSNYFGYVDFLWGQKFEGKFIGYWNQISLSLDKTGQLTMFHNTWGLYRVATWDIKFTKEQAINETYRLALERLGNWTIWDGHKWVSYNFTGETELKLENVTLAFMPLAQYTLYPCWVVNVIFDPIPDVLRSIGDYGFQATFRADTGELIDSNPMGVIGSLEQAPHFEWLILLSLAVIAIAFTALYIKNTSNQL